QALQYFLRLEPLLGVDPGRFGADMEKQAFQLAVATEETLLDRIQKAIAERLESGEVNEGPQAVQDLLDAAGVSVPNSGYSNAVFRTAAVDAYNTGAWNEYQDVAEEFPVYEYTNPVDTRSRPHHAAKNGQYYSSKTPFAQVRGEGPENEINCVLPGAWVQGRVGQALKAWYAGQAIEVRTRRGHCLAVTVQHPVLTEDGFVPAGQLQQGDYLTCYGGDDEVAAEGKDIEDTPALIEEVFGALQTTRATVVKRAAAVDLYGDGQFLHGDIHVIGTGGLLGFRGDPQDAQRVAQIVLADADVQHPGGPGDGSGAPHSVAVRHAAARRLGRLDLTEAGRRVDSLPPLQGFGFALRAERNARVFEAPADNGTRRAGGVRKLLFGFSGEVARGQVGSGDAEPRFRVGAPLLLCLGPGARLNAAIPQPAHESVTLHAKFAAKLLSRFPGEVALDEVVEIRRFHYRGPVYDLGTDVGYFIANHGQKARCGIVLKNCRCSFLPIDKATWADLKAAGARLSRA
ncbi:MAG TPA: phage minor head protein, partial [Gemmataceae bacterium]|nr:phage minor head protein [Gemmataceae bacterium]